MQSGTAVKELMTSPPASAAPGQIADPAAIASIETAKRTIDFVTKAPSRRRSGYFQFCSGLAFYAKSSSDIKACSIKKYAGRGGKPAPTSWQRSFPAAQRHRMAGTGRRRRPVWRPHQRWPPTLSADRRPAAAGSSRIFQRRRDLGERLGSRGEHAFGDAGRLSCQQTKPMPGNT